MGKLSPHIFSVKETELIKTALVGFLLETDAWSPKRATIELESEDVEALQSLFNEFKISDDDVSEITELFGSGYETEGDPKEIYHVSKEILN